MLLDAIEFLISHERSSMPKDSFEASAVQLRRLEIYKAKAFLMRSYSGSRTTLLPTKYPFIPSREKQKVPRSRI
jgi:hypothetical protein